MESEFLPENTPRGLPGPLPEGERILWKGAPTTAGMTLRAFHAQAVAAWFVLMALVLGAGTAAGGSFVRALGVSVPTLLIGAGALALLVLFGWLVHRTTVYTITDKRVVLHVGIALPITLNLPFAQIESAALHNFADGSGDIPLVLHEGQRVAYLHLWPHARPWRVSRPEPMLRSVSDAERVANLLAMALAAQVGQQVGSQVGTYAGGEDEAVQPVIAARPRPAEPAVGLAAAGMR